MAMSGAGSLAFMTPTSMTSRGSTCPVRQAPGVALLEAEQALAAGAAIVTVGTDV